MEWYYIVLIALGGWLLVSLACGAMFMFGVTVGRRKRLDEILEGVYIEKINNDNIQFRSTRQ